MILTSAREGTHSSVVGRIQLYSLYSPPSYSRGAPIHDTIPHSRPMSGVRTMQAHGVA